MKNWVIVIFYICISLTAYSQEVAKLRSSPLAIISMRYKNTYIKITYSQPQKRGRVIFGEVVPFGKVWRTGANEATEITLTKDIQMKGTFLKAGTYSLFTIPEKDKWTIIINKDVGLWGSYNYNSAQDVLKFDVPVLPVESIAYEPFTLKFDQQNDVADLLIVWDKTKVSIPIKFIY